MSEAEDASSGKGSNLTAVEAISARLAEVTRLAEKLDAKLCEAGARTRPVPMSSSAVSSTPSPLSSSSAPPTSASGQIHTISAVTTSSIGITAPLISSSTVQLQPKCVSTILSSATSNENVGTTTKDSAQSVNGTGVGDEKVESKVVDEGEAGTGEESRQDDLGGMNDEKLKGEVAEDVIEKSFDDNLAEDSNMDEYVTATECSITPTVRSRSESFVTSPEWEDLAAPTSVTHTCCDTGWNIEETKLKRTESLETEKIDASMDIPKPEVEGTENEGKQSEKLVSMEKRVEEKSGKIVKEVTETTTLRVSHDTRLDIASYKVISNTTQDHRENVDVKEIKDLERIVLPDVHEKTNGSHYEMDSVSKSESYSRRDELSTKTDDIERVVKFAKICEINQESRTISVDTSAKDIALSLKEYRRRHEDSGIEMSPTKKDENLEGQDFLEAARKVSSIEAISINGDRRNGYCNCNCNHEAACFDRFSIQQNFIELNSVNDNRCLPLPNAS